MGEPDKKPPTISGPTVSTGSSGKIPKSFTNRSPTGSAVGGGRLLLYRRFSSDLEDPGTARRQTTIAYEHASRLGRPITWFYTDEPEQPRHLLGAGPAFPNNKGFHHA